MSKGKFEAARPTVQALQDAGSQVQAQLHDHAVQLGSTLQSPGGVVGLRVAVIGLGLAALVWAARARHALVTRVARRRG